MLQTLWQTYKPGTSHGLQSTIFLCFCLYLMCLQKKRGMFAFGRYNIHIYELVASLGEHLTNENVFDRKLGIVFAGTGEIITWQKSTLSYTN